jgi:monovalent cation/hydrogen antiporter
VSGLERLLGLFVAAVVLAAVARRVGAPYPVFLALGGAVLAFVPGAPTFAVPPDLALALFVAPVLLDAAYDASLRDLKDNWAPVGSLVIIAVGLTTAAVAVVAHALIPRCLGPRRLRSARSSHHPTRWRPLRCFARYGRRNAS